MNQGRFFSAVMKERSSMNIFGQVHFVLLLNFVSSLLHRSRRVRWDPQLPVLFGLPLPLLRHHCLFRVAVFEGLASAKPLDEIKVAKPGYIGHKHKFSLLLLDKPTSIHVMSTLSVWSPRWSQFHFGNFTILIESHTDKLQFGLLFGIVTFKGEFLPPWTHLQKKHGRAPGFEASSQRRTWKQSACWPVRSLNRNHERDIVMTPF